ncbi:MULTISPECIES: hemerythrin domain-containing protein [Mycobacteroides]|uniref:hemerythrin domain-containing protein n=1 Tax=Mycobacteroides TaxID=670516 RepID=UPI0008A8BBE1|nr:MULTISPECIES: hemerythrin domain-containing protein [Mycobacteroides]AYM40948.1 hemerythrin domain-containing protein [[Mycobacterium] chelonae subsp. gwanakae]OHU16514.1 hemerythrin [Mycobacteroides chelonae]TDZ91638.1 iron-sulfur cluster repair di-iron protein [Mycobacteroides salmoniphilum]
MTNLAVSVELKREHREIDLAIETFIEGLDSGSVHHELLVDTIEALRRHIYIEEVFLFPPLRDAGVVMPIFVMMREHGQLWRTMDTLTDLLNSRKNSLCLRDMCMQLLDQLHQHNFKEELIIYPNADTGLPLHTSVEVSRFVETGQAPDGWVCQQAGG